MKSVIRDVNDHNRSLLQKNSDHNPIENSEQEHLRLRDSGRIQQWDQRPSSPRPPSRNDAYRGQSTASTTNGDRSGGKVHGVDLERLILQGGRGPKGKERARRSEEDVDVDEQEEMRRLRATKRGGHRDDREKSLRQELLKARDPKFPTKCVIKQANDIKLSDHSLLTRLLSLAIENETGHPPFWVRKKILNEPTDPNLPAQQFPNRARKWTNISPQHMTLVSISHSKN